MSLYLGGWKIQSVLLTIQTELVFSPERNILANPFKRFEDMQMLRHTKTLGIVQVDDAVWKKLTKEEKYLLEYKYFRRKRMLEGEFAGMKLDFSERTYFRRQIRLSAKLNGLFALHGLGEAWFEKNLRGVPYIAAALERMREGGKGEFSDKRAKTMLACQKTRRLPRKADERKEREISRATS